MQNLHLIVRDQFPQFVRADYPVFVEFVKAYYKWLDIQSIGKIGHVVDIDNTPTEFVQYFSKQLDVANLFSGSDLFDVKYLKNIKEIYSSKGSERALVQLLRIVKGAETTIQYPSERVLRASDGRWSQEQFITVETTFGNIPDQITEFFVVYALSSNKVLATKFEQIDINKIRLFYRHTSDIEITPNISIQIRNAAGLVSYAGKIVRSPASVSVLSSGADWLLGQVITIPGTTRNTIARVAEIDSIGGILKVEIIDYGFNHLEPQVVVISPYPVKPIGSTIDLVSVPIGAGTDLLHTLTISDELDGCGDFATGSFTGIFPGSYSLENYFSGDYTAVQAFAVGTIPSPPLSSGDTSLTSAQWLASRSTLLLEYDSKVNLKGKWTDDRGQISNEQIRLQDNFFFQQHSYVIDSTASPASYNDLAKTTHVAGLKMFSNYSLATDVEFSVTGDTSFPFVTLDIIDVSNTAEDVFTNFTKQSVDAATAADTDTITFTKRSVDAATATDTDTITFTKQPVDAATATDVDTHDFTKQPVDAATAADADTYDFTKLSADAATAADDDTYDFTKLSADAATAVDVDTHDFTKQPVDAATAADADTYDFTKLSADAATAADADTYDFVKLIEDQSVTSDVDTHDFTKLSADAATAADADTHDFTKSVTDTATLSESISDIFDKYNTDTAVVADVAQTSPSKTSTDTVTTASAISTDLYKYFGDAATVSSGTTSSTQTLTYDSEAYFAENYVASELTLTIGA